MDAVRLLHLRGEGADLAEAAALCAPMLAPADLAALARTPCARRRARRSISRALVRRLVDQHCPGGGDEVVFTTPALGKPALRGRPCHFSVSYSGADMLIAVSTAGPIGVDLETVRDRPPERLGPLICSPAEDERLRRPGGSPDSLAMLFRLWTAKEALLKATGEGLAAAMPSISLEKLLDRGGRAETRLSRRGRHWSVRAWTEGGSALALAYAAPPHSRIRFESLPLASLATFA